MPDIKATDEALYANRDWLESESEAVAILVEELIKTWREINEDPASIVALREKYNVLPDIEQIEVDELVPAFTDGVSIDLFPNNGGSAESVLEDFTFFTTSGTLEGNASDFKVERGRCNFQYDPGGPARCYCDGKPAKRPHWSQA